MKLHIVAIHTTKWSTLAKYSNKAVKEGTYTYVYHDSINFTRELIKAVQKNPKEMVVLCGKENHMKNALKVANQFQEIFPTITQLESVV